MSHPDYLYTLAVARQRDLIAQADVTRRIRRSKPKRAR